MPDVIALWLPWQGSPPTWSAPGGVFRMDVRGGGWASGHVVAVEPHRGIVFTWNHERRPS